ncbi:hypothetical protein LCGC14_1348370 [marine sediment metagenome]|uniref:Uncharacterized protein n=1 Tax=marine sediment metagenome TaxID=412755 RepID=A0A0F9KXM0_9ZZZZ
MKAEKEIELNTSNEKGFIKIDWGRQGGIVLAYIVILLGYYGIIANTMLYDAYGKWISFVDMDRTILSWTYTTYINNFALPALLLFFVCFLLTYKEDIPHYGIKASIWLVPILIAEGFIFNALMFGFTIDPIILRFGRIEGYIDIIILFALVISGAISGMKLKQFNAQRKSV